MPDLQSALGHVSILSQECLDANIEENDFTVISYEDLEYEIELLAGSLRKKLSFIDNRGFER
jgi:hypothetical protein